MTAKLFPITFLVAFFLEAANAQAQYVVITDTQAEVGPLQRTEWTISPSPNPIERFKLTRWVKQAPGAPIRGSILLLPSLGSTFALYEQRDAGGGLGTSVAEFFAARGVKLTSETTPTPSASGRPIEFVFVSLGNLGENNAFGALQRSASRNGI